MTNYLNQPLHPYTRELLRAIPNIRKTNIEESSESKGRKEECKEQDDIKNNIERTTMDTGCPYRKRCQHRTEECEREQAGMEKSRGRALGSLQENQKFCEYLEKSVTPFHCVLNSKKDLESEWLL